MDGAGDQVTRKRTALPKHIITWLNRMPLLFYVCAFIFGYEKGRHGQREYIVVAGYKTATKEILSSHQSVERAL